MSKNQENKLAEDYEKALDSCNLYLVTATFTGDDENGKKLSLDVHSFILVPKSIKDEDVGDTLRKNIPIDEGDKMQYKKMKAGDRIQFLGYTDGVTAQDDEAKEGDVFTFKRCGFEFVQVFEKCKGNDNNGFLFKPNELGPFPPPPNPFFDSQPSLGEPKQEPQS